MAGTPAAENGERACEALGREIAEHLELAERHGIPTSAKGVGKVTAAGDGGCAT